MHNGEIKRITYFEVLLSINNASITVITQKMRFLYINEFILETSYSVCMERLIISLHENINN